MLLFNMLLENEYISPWRFELNTAKYKILDIKTPLFLVISMWQNQIVFCFCKFALQEEDKRERYTQYTP